MTVSITPSGADTLPTDFQSEDLASTFANGTSSRIPCEFYLNGILIPVPTPDKGQAFLLFDTGANEPMLSASFAERMRIRSTTQFSASGIGGDVPQGGVTGGITFSLPGVTFRHARWAILPDTELDAAYGRPVVGVLGMDLLKDFVIRIDYVRQAVEFIRPESFHPPGHADCLSLTMSSHGPMAQAIVQTTRASAPGLFLIDTGSNGALDLSKVYQDTHPLLEFRPFAQSGASGVGGVMLISEAICPAIMLGGSAVKEPLVDLENSANGANASIDGSIGNEIWRRFNVILALPHEKLYLQRNAHFSDPFSYVSAGMSLQATGTHYEKLTVGAVLPGSASDQAGFLAGDVILKLDELQSRPLTIANVYPVIHRPGTFHFTVRRNDRTLALAFTLKNPALAKEK